MNAGSFSFCSVGSLGLSCVLTGTAYLEVGVRVSPLFFLFCVAFCPRNVQGPSTSFETKSRTPLLARLVLNGSVVGGRCLDSMCYAKTPSASLLA